VSVIMDGDGQHPASLVPEMLLKYREGYDQVVARRTRAGDPRSRRLSAKIYYRLINRFIEVRLDDGIGDFRLLSRRAVDSLLSMPEYNRFSKGLFSWIGFPTAVVDYVNVRRLEGQPKWGFRRLLDYGIDGVLSFNSKPLRLAVWVGLTVTSLSLAYVAWLIGVAIVRGVESPGYVTLITSVLILGGLQLIAIGVIGEYIGRIYFEVKRRPAFLVKEATTPLRDVQRDRDHQVDGG
jgi:glycosyltransferase involved in cell wall biosynthesis